MESIIKPYVDSFAIDVINSSEADAIVTYDDLLEQQHRDFLAMSYGHSEE